jgi:hypothetical protein
MNPRPQGDFEMEPSGVNANRFALISGGLMALGASE